MPAGVGYEALIGLFAITAIEMAANMTATLSA